MTFLYKKRVRAGVLVFSACLVSFSIEALQPNKPEESVFSGTMWVRKPATTVHSSVFLASAHPQGEPLGTGVYSPYTTKDKLFAAGAVATTTGVLMAVRWALLRAKPFVRR